MKAISTILRGTFAASLAIAVLAAPGLGPGPAPARAAEDETLYLVRGAGGPGFFSPEETVRVLENAILPGFDHLMRLEAEGTIVAGGLPVGKRAFVFIVRAGSNAEADRIVRDIPFWGVLRWTVTPLQSFAGRAAMERDVVEALKAQ